MSHAASRTADLPPDPALVAGAPDADERVAVALQRILQSHEFPAFSRQMSELLATLESPELSAQRLANVVLRDYSLTLKVVRTANSAHYNRSGRPIRSVTQAMMLLGVQTVRSLATGLLLFDHYHHRSTGLKELLLLSLLTANHAREAALRIGLAEPEAVHLCGMCRNLGEVLVACHFPAAYATILREARERLAGQATPDVRAATGAAAWPVLGFGFESLGDAMLAHWGMPPEVRASARATGRAGETVLQTLTAFGHELTTVVYRADGAAGPAAGVSAVLDRYGERLRLSREALTQVLESAVAETRELFADAGVSLDGLRLARQTAAALAELGGPEAGGADADADGAGTAPAGAAHPVPIVTPPRGTPSDALSLEALRDRLLADVEAVLPPEAGYELHAVMLLVLEAIMRGGPADRAAFCLVGTDRSQLEARIVLGDDVERLTRELSVPMERRLSPLARTLRQGVDAVLRDDRAAAADEARWVRGLGARRVSVLPLVVDGTVIGCLYGDTLSEGGPADAAALAFLAALRGAAVRAVVLRRDAARTPAGAVQDTAPAPTRAVAVERGEVVLRLLRGASPAALAEELGVPEAVLGAWRDAFLAGALAGLSGEVGSG